MGSRSLDTYRQKRDPARTPEPFAAPAGATGRRRAPLRRPAARGAAPALGPAPGDRRRPGELGGAARPLDRPEGEAPGGADRGPPARVRRLRGGHPGRQLRRRGDDRLGPRRLPQRSTATRPAKACARGKLDIELRGHKLRGRWALVRTKGSDGKEWLLFKKPEGPLDVPEPVVAQPARCSPGSRSPSCATACGATPSSPHWRRRRARRAARCRPRRSARCWPRPPTRAFSRAGWLFELKYDGVRVLIVARRPASRRGCSRAAGATSRRPFPRSPTRRRICRRTASSSTARSSRSTSAAPARSSACSSASASPTRGRSRAPRATVPVQVFGFDLLAVAGYDLRALPLATRKAILRRLLPAQGVIRYADHVEEHGEAFFDAACKHGVEGHRRQARRLALHERPALARLGEDQGAEDAPTSPSSATCPAKGAREPLGSLMLAWRRDGELVYAGNVGSGLSEHAHRDAARRSCAPRRAPTPAFTDRRAAGARRRVRRAGAGRRGALHRSDRARPAAPAGVRAAARRQARSSDVRRAPGGRRSVSALAAIRHSTRLPHPRAGERRDRASATEPGRRTRFALSNLDKVFWPADGYTKGDLLAYYDRIWPAHRAVPARPAGGADALSRRHRGQELLPEERARVRPRLGGDLPHRGHRVLRLQRARGAALRHQPRLHPAARVERAARSRSSIRTGRSSTSIPRARRSATCSPSRAASTRCSSRSARRTSSRPPARTACTCSFRSAAR